MALLYVAPGTSIRLPAVLVAPATLFTSSANAYGFGPGRATAAALSDRAIAPSTSNVVAQSTPPSTTPTNRAARACVPRPPTHTLHWIRSSKE
ncbi:hypothetical protein AT728_13935 [Streptomyces silvensis]|uniref:Secreted protein n=1 Tax=Streptomyces silvensis TaxID=1765722 RepID=A0A0W7WZ57_9ACTN|nr:hypothetical protein AT728_13935 [Streptomyces silvensis]